MLPGDPGGWSSGTGSPKARSSSADAFNGSNPGSGSGRNVVLFRTLTSASITNCGNSIDPSSTNSASKLPFVTGRFDGFAELLNLVVTRDAGVTARIELRQFLEDLVRQSTPGLRVAWKVKASNLAIPRHTSGQRRKRGVERVLVSRRHIRR